MDGEEVLYPPGTVTQFHGQVGTLRIGGASAPLYLLVECSPNEAASGDVVDDFHFGPTPARMT